MSASSLRSFEYLEQLPETAFRRLYQQPSTALAVFRRFLPHLAKTIITAILFMPDPLPISHLDSWVRSESKRAQEHAIDVLERLKIVSMVADGGAGAAYRVTNPFCNSLREALTGGGDHRSFGVPGGVANRDRVSVESLARFARAQWDNILYYVVGSSGSLGADEIELSEGAKTLLREAGFVDVVRGVAKITEKGFTFLLQEVDAQVWSLLIEYLEYAGQELGLDNVDVLSFLFTIANLEVGQDYSIATLTQTQQGILDDLHDFGIVFRPDPEAPYFYPTPLASTLISDSRVLNDLTSSSKKTLGQLSLTAQPANQPGFIVMETNYRIYAYTSSPLQIKILSLFTKLSTRYANMVAGRLTKESIRRAIRLGITSQQIISYLTAHAHPIMTSRAKQAGGSSSYGGVQQQQPILPPTVVDQIRLWQIEGDRMKTSTGFLFRKFADRNEYRDIAEYADQIGVLVWRNDEKMLFFATRYEQLQKFISNRKNRASQSSVPSSSRTG